MGVGINVSTGEIVGKQKGNNEKTFTVLADTVIGKAADRNHGHGRPRAWEDYPYSQRDKGNEFLARYLDGRRDDVASGLRDKTNEKAFDREGNLCVETTIWAGREAYNDIYTEVTKDGFFVYPSAKDMDERNHEAAYYTTDARDAADIQASIVVAKAERLEARKNIVKDYCRGEQQEKDRLKRQIKSLSNTAKKGPEGKELKEKLQEAQKALDDKKAIVHESPEYKALLAPGENESISTVKSEKAEAGRKEAGYQSKMESVAISLGLDKSAVEKSFNGKQPVYGFLLETYGKDIDTVPFEMSSKDIQNAVDDWVGKEDDGEQRILKCNAGNNIFIACPGYSEEEKDRISKCLNDEVCPREMFEVGISDEVLAELETASSYEGKIMSLNDGKLYDKEEYYAGKLDETLVPSDEKENAGEGMSM